MSGATMDVDLRNLPAAFNNIPAGGIDLSPRARYRICFNFGDGPTDVNVREDGTVDCGPDWDAVTLGGKIIGFNRKPVNAPRDDLPRGWVRAEDAVPYERHFADAVADPGRPSRAGTGVRLMSRPFWFAGQVEDSEAPWRAFIQLDDRVDHLATGFPTEADCLDYIRDEILKAANPSIDRHVTSLEDRVTTMEGLVRESLAAERADPAR